MHPVVAIDGPSGAGKGTVARAVAHELGWPYVDTGAMYRAVAWRARDAGLSLEARDEERVAAVALNAAIEVGGERVAIDGHDVTGAIRTPEIDDAAARVARLPRVRAALVARQRQYAAVGPVVMEGRDIGTVVFPGAAVKVYLDASPAARAARRSTDPAHGLSRAGAIDVVADALAARDHLDRTRRASPLRRAPDATVLDTTGLQIESVVARVLEIVRACLGRG
ncbi:MAG: (d)CMP kinase [Acidobacteria bacterium]|nr:(d)CMP kinase [Acidobacteriota bacterium]